jgi:outer membrane lipoprotein-sorting protein
MTFVLALVCLAQEPTAEETFKKIEESIEKAKTLSFSFRVDGQGPRESPDRELKAKGVMLMKEGGRFNCSMKMLRLGREEGTSLVFDGAKLMMKRDEGEPNVAEVPKSHRGAATTLVARLGALMSGMMPRGGGAPQEDVKKTLELKDLKPGDDDKEAKTLTYTVRLAARPGGPTPSLDCKLWYDPKTLALLKRTIAIRQGETVEGTLTETYTDYVLNGDIPDDKFRIEEPKPKEK